LFVGINGCNFVFALISLAVNSAGLQDVVAHVPLAANVALEAPVPVEAVGAARNQNQPQSLKAKVKKAPLPALVDIASLIVAHVQSGCPRTLTMVKC